MCENMKREEKIVVERVWGPGDTYLKVGDKQVFRSDGFRRGQKVYRYVTEWKPVEDEDDG